MRKRNLLALGGLLATFGLFFAVAAQAQAPRPNTAFLPLPKRIAAETKLTDEQVEKVLRALGPAISDALARGQTVELPGLGLFRVVRVPEHRDLVDGRPATIAPSNGVEFLAAGELAEAANSGGAVPAETVPPFQYVPLPNQVKGQRVGSTRMPNVRTR
jgi:nucleoid DNA-binding protein